METKICTKCKIERDLDSFGISSRSKDGRLTQCKICLKEYKDNWIRTSNMIAPTTRVCSGCKQEKSLQDDFTINKYCRFNRTYECRVCATKRTLTWNKNNPERTRELRKTYRVNNLEAVREKERKFSKERRFRQYNITKEDFIKILESQNNQCAICSNTKPGGASNQWAIDHDHNTGAVRGILCHKCNRGLGHFNDNIEMLIKATNYLIRDKRILRSVI